MLRKDPDPEPNGSTSFWEADPGSAVKPKARPGSGFAEKYKKAGSYEGHIGTIEAHSDPWRLTMEPWRDCLRPAVADLRGPDLDSYPHQGGNGIRTRGSASVKSRFRIEEKSRIRTTMTAAASFEHSRIII